MIIKEYDRLLTKQFLHGLDDEDMISEILSEVLTLEDIDNAVSERVLLWAKQWMCRGSRKKH